MTQIYHAHLYGTRTSKYDWLQNHDVLSTDWQPLTPRAPFYLLIPQNTDLLGEYEQSWKITDIMPVNSTGVKTHRDHFVIDFNDERLKRRISEFRDLQIPDDEIATRYSLPDTRDWKLRLRRRSLAANREWEQYSTKCLYRPFDIRAYYHHQDVVELPRNEIMKHIYIDNNLCLCITRQINGEFKHTICTEYVVTDCSLSNATRE